MRITYFTCFFSIVTLAIFFFSTIPVHSQCLEDQKSLLLQLKNSFSFNPNSSIRLVNWTQSKDCCRWMGVTCDQSSHVIGLELDGESIFGGFNHSSSLFSLQFLEKLNLANNNFSFAPIPSGFGILANLIYLNLSKAGFSGQIPIELSRLTRLVKLDLSTRYFSGIPALQIETPNLFPLFRNLSRLTELYLDGVNISANRYEWSPAISSSLPNLRVLSLRDCFLSGPIDSSLQNLQFLSEIYLDMNNISAPVPDFFANFTNLTTLSLSSCNLYGTFHGRVLQLKSLKTLDLSYNRWLQGSLPKFHQNGSLQTLVLSYTKFSGMLPDSIGNLRNLSRIEISNCSFSGPIPNTLENLTQLVYLDLSYNMFTSGIPSFQMSKKLRQIRLSHNALTGPVPSIYFEGLSDLEYINLGYNSLNGGIPSSLFSLPSLQEIWLHNNQFSEVSRFPNGSLSPLHTLDLSSNKLKGPIPTYFFDFQMLLILSLSFNNFNGTIQLESIQKLGNLKRLELSHNSLTVDASITNSSLTSFPQLTMLGLASCKLQKFPTLMNQSLLFHLDLSDNQISGVIPNCIWDVGDGTLDYLNLSCNLLVGLQSEYIMPGNLVVLDLHSNQLRGEIPLPPETAIYVDYSSNNFSSSIPAGIGSLIPYANFFSLSNNMLSGLIPPTICNGSYLQVLDLSNNGFSGTIPRCLVDTSTMTLGVLNLKNNNLTGNITGTFPESCALRTLDLNGNHLEGQVPKSLVNCANAEVLNLGANNINGNFPCFLTNLSSLRVLVLRSNKFQGNIFCLGIHSNIWPKLQIIDLALNNFSGILPREFFLQRKAMIDEDNAQLLNHLRFVFLELNKLYYQDSVTVINKGSEMKLVKILTTFTAIDISNNSFEGEIPDTIGDLKSLHALNLSHNGLTGSIPSSLGNLRQLGSLDLSWNKLSGSIPMTLANLTFLSVLNLSYNQLVGMIPKHSQFQTFLETSFGGNKGLCGAPLISSCRKGKPPGSSTPTYDEDEINWVYITATLGYMVGFGAIVGPLLYWKRWRQCYYKQVDRVILKIVHYQEKQARHQRRRDNRNLIRRHQQH